MSTDRIKCRPVHWSQRLFDDVENLTAVALMGAMDGRQAADVSLNTTMMTSDQFTVFGCRESAFCGTGNAFRWLHTVRALALINTGL